MVFVPYVVMSLSIQSFSSAASIGDVGNKVNNYYSNYQSDLLTASKRANDFWAALKKDVETKSIFRIYLIKDKSSIEKKDLHKFLHHDLWVGKIVKLLTRISFSVLISTGVNLCLSFFPTIPFLGTFVGKLTELHLWLTSLFLFKMQLNQVTFYKEIFVPSMIFSVLSMGSFLLGYNFCFGFVGELLMFLLSLPMVGLPLAAYFLV